MKAISRSMLVGLTLGLASLPGSLGLTHAPSSRFQGVAPRNQRQRRKALRQQRSNRFNKRG